MPVYKLQYSLTLGGQVGSDTITVQASIEHLVNCETSARKAEMLNLQRSVHEHVLLGFQAQGLQPDAKLEVLQTVKKQAKKEEVPKPAVKPLDVRQTSCTPFNLEEPYDCLKGLPKAPPLQKPRPNVLEELHRRIREKRREGVGNEGAETVKNGE